MPTVQPKLLKLNYFDRMDNKNLSFLYMHDFVIWIKIASIVVKRTRNWNNGLGFKGNERLLIFEVEGHAETIFRESEFLPQRSFAQHRRIYDTFSFKSIYPDYF